MTVADYIEQRAFRMRADEFTDELRGYIAHDRRVAVLSLAEQHHVMWSAGEDAPVFEFEYCVAAADAFIAAAERWADEQVDEQENA